MQPTITTGTAARLPGGGTIPMNTSQRGMPLPRTRGSRRHRHEGASRWDTGWRWISALAMPARLTVWGMALARIRTARTTTRSRAGVGILLPKELH